MTTTISMLAIDLAKGSFQVCAIGADGTIIYNRALSRARFAALLAEVPSCIVAMKACAADLASNRGQRHSLRRIIPTMLRDHPHGTVAKLTRKLVPCSVHHSSFSQIGASWKAGTCVDDWFNNHRLFGPIGHIPPAEAEANYYAARETLDMVA